MSEQVDNGSAVNQESVAQNHGDQQESSFVPKDAYERAMGDLMKWKSRARELEQKASAWDEEKSSIERQKLEEQQKYKELYERAQNEAKSYKEKVNQVQSAYLNDVKYQALEREAMKAGLRQEALADLKMYDTSNVIVETTSEGNANVLGAREWLEEFKTTRPYLFQEYKAPNVNGATPNGSVNEPKKLTARELLALEKTDPKAYRELYEKQFLNRK